MKKDIPKIGSLIKSKYDNNIFIVVSYRPYVDNECIIDAYSIVDNDTYPIFQRIYTETNMFSLVE